MKHVFVAGHLGMVGSAITKQLQNDPQLKVTTRSRLELDLNDQKAVFDFFSDHNFDEVYLAAAKVGGILANSKYPAEFIYENLMIECNVIHGAYQAGVKKLLFLGSSCIYPKLAEQPISEEALLTGKLESTNEPYAIAKIAGIKLCESYSLQYNVDYRCVMPTNLYGRNDNFHSENSHVIPALLRRFHDAKLNEDSKVVAWGSGTPKREFLHVDDMASASIFVMNLDKSIYDANTEPMLKHINIGTGEDCSINDLVKTVAKVVDFQGQIEFDTSKPDGPPRKLLNVDKLTKLGWSNSISLEDGLRSTYIWFLKHQDDFRQT